ncbi:MAG: NAD(+) synthase, partial [Leptospira sp.]|nr:NAD(+) synthase [Leptospira sp.]
MKRIKICSISMKTTPLDFHGNTDTIISVLKDTKTENSLVLFPELCVTGYSCEDAFYNSEVWEKSMDAISEILPSTKNKIALIGLPVFNSPYLYNACIVLANGKIWGAVPKKNLANTGLHYEKRWFRERSSDLGSIATPYGEIPFGNLLFSFDSIKFGIEICEDSWVMNRPSHSYTENGADIIFSPGASHFAFGKQEIRRRIFRESSRTQNSIFVFSNLNGNEAGRVIFDGGCFVSENGEITGEGKRLHFSDFEILETICDIDSSRHEKAKAFRESGNGNMITVQTVQIGFGLKEIQNPVSLPVQVSPENIYTIFTDAVSLGLFDYLLKSGSKGFTLSLSGGADSAACAILVKTMQSLAERELGMNIFAEKGMDAKSILITIYQETKNNSPLTKKSARELAEELKTIHHEIAIDPQVDLVTKTIEDITKTKLSWEKFDLALQNVQARIRSPIVWMLANVNNHLLLSTGNRSEASAGYTTMDGDSSGSVAPIAGVSKEFILNWLKYMNTGEDKRFLPVKSLSGILERRPSAELKPISEKQEDEKDLM